MRIRHHSKGPWTKQFGAFTPGFASAMRIFSGNRAVADVFWGDNTSEQNANLIAAAPDLYKALDSALMDLVDIRDFTEPGTSAHEALTEIVEEAQKALRKARGEE